MDITVEKRDNVMVVRLVGELDAMSAAVAQKHVLPLVAAGTRILLDLTDVPYMSSAGLRMLLSTYRNISQSGGSIVLVGVGDEIRDTMAVTGFLGFFQIRETLNMGLQALA
ncbi:MAG: STAS domain-containing protein [Chloroflexota bacterium]|nr:STAS domain-containing protein [Chloroflexota bacterium]